LAGEAIFLIKLLLFKEVFLIKPLLVKEGLGRSKQKIILKWAKKINSALDKCVVLRIII